MESWRWLVKGRRANFRSMLGVGGGFYGSRSDG
jgi:hypothetical protein